MNPRRIPNNFRLQTYIDEELNLAQELLATKPRDERTSEDLANIALAFLEVGNWVEATKHCEHGLSIENEKPEELRNKEMMAVFHYILATRDRELNQCDEARAQYKKAEELTQSNWLKSNILRNLGLVYLKEQKFSEAADIFKQGVEFTATDSELRGALPAMHNYWALCSTRSALKAQQDPADGLKIFADTTELYNQIFDEKEFSEADKLKCHDWQSHQFHRGMVLCEMGEKENETIAETKFQQAEKLLLNVLEGRKANKADDQRLGDVCAWLGRTYTGLKQTENARQFFYLALRYYNKAFPKVSADAPDAKQITEVVARVDALPKMSGPGELRQSVFTPTRAMPMVQQAEQDARERHTP